MVNTFQDRQVISSRTFEIPWGFRRNCSLRPGKLPHLRQSFAEPLLHAEHNVLLESYYSTRSIIILVSWERKLRLRQSKYWPEVPQPVSSVGTCIQNNFFLLALMPSSLSPKPDLMWQRELAQASPTGFLPPAFSSSDSASGDVEAETVPFLLGWRAWSGLALVTPFPFL